MIILSRGMAIDPLLIRKEYALPLMWPILLLSLPE
jgi:hypothetical protein